ncbi:MULTISPECIES: hypothetical protein [Cupriavidus]
MRQSELLGRVADGAVLRITRDPWGKLLPSVTLSGPRPQDRAEVVHRWQISRMVDAGLLAYDNGAPETSDRLVPTVAGLAAGRAWNRARRRGGG